MPLSGLFLFIKFVAEKCLEQKLAPKERKREYGKVKVIPEQDHNFTENR